MLCKLKREPPRTIRRERRSACMRKKAYVLHNKASLFRLTVQGSDGEEHTLYELRLHNWDDAVSSLRFTFWDALPEEQIVAYMEAIAYSYVYS